MNEEETVKREKEIERGNKAKAILDSEIFQESFTAVRADYMESWEKSTLDDSDKREKIWMMVAHLDDVKSHIVSVLQTGLMSQRQLADIPSIKPSFEEDSGRLRTFLGG